MSASFVSRVIKQVTIDSQAAIQTGMSPDEKAEARAAWIADRLSGQIEADITIPPEETSNTLNGN